MQLVTLNSIKAKPNSSRSLRHKMEQLQDKQCHIPHMTITHAHETMDQINLEHSCQFYYAPVRKVKIFHSNY